MPELIACSLRWLESELMNTCVLIRMAHQFSFLQAHLEDSSQIPVLDNLSNEI